MIIFVVTFPPFGKESPVSGQLANRSPGSCATDLTHCLSRRNYLQFSEPGFLLRMDIIHWIMYNLDTKNCCAQNNRRCLGLFCSSPLSSISTLSSSLSLSHVTIIGFVIYGSDPQVQLVSWIGLKTACCDRLLLHVLQKVSTKSIISVMDSYNYF